jgi:adenosylmethionine-8-amino-7-oxononanoate aminotransferase
VECQIVDSESHDTLEMDIEIGDRIDKNCQALGLIVRPLWNMCVFSPPLVINMEQIDEMFNILEKGIIITTNELRKEGLWKG